MLIKYHPASEESIPGPASEEEGSTRTLVGPFRGKDALSA